MTLLDWLLALIVGASIVNGFITGFTRTAFGILATVFGVLLGFWFYDIPAGWIVGWIGSKAAANIIGFLVVLTIVVMVGTLIGRVISRAFKMVGLGIVDRLAGAGFGVLRGLLAAAAVTTVMLAATPRPVPSWMQGSLFLPYALGTSHVISSLAPKAVTDAVSSSIADVKQAWNEEVKRAKEQAEKSFKAAPPPKEVEPEVVTPAPKAKKKLKSKLPKPVDQ